MSKRDPEQALEPALSLVIQGADAFQQATAKRLESGEWNTAHQLEISRLSADLQIMANRLRILRREVW